jgi:hypothetical protein
MHIVTWFRLFEEDGEMEGIPFTLQELTALKEYITSNPINFSNLHCHLCAEEEMTTECNMDEVLPPVLSQQPNNYILRKTPQIPKKVEHIYPCMDIELLNEREELHHSYNLAFDIIGRIDE